MIEENAIITEKFDQHVHVEIERKTACGICGQTRGCGNATFGKMLGHQQQVIRADNAIHANVGDHVVIGVDEQVFLRTVLYLYVLPLVTLFVGAWLANVVFHEEVYVMLGALFGLLAGIFVLKMYLNQAVPSSQSSTHAIILRRADDMSSN